MKNWSGAGAAQAAGVIVSASPPARSSTAAPRSTMSRLRCSGSNGSRRVFERVLRDLPLPKR